ncbi:MAG TPA: methylated-DNA--[protein]-cysteine S-methyltransferase [Actinophytocola sp.]|uniref:methylated-DNA--[protein]-cysteine S-methyltransferase n=1 Tax=Actinophytocola sp. TaxID=1872138 RepID=UPI002DFF032F|nr:methylated-DNA--[protein]-cysteine S-methyltransferase [Actinophytocola sp.]
MTAYSSTVDTPIGPFTAIIATDEVVLASGWTDSFDALLPVIAPHLRPIEVRRRPDLGAVTKAIRLYHEGNLTAVDDIPVRQSSGQFITHAWDILRTVPPGKPTTYTNFAALSGRPEAIRAAASACARNAAALFVPCHRIVRTDGSLGGFRWGLPVKCWLLNHELPSHQLKTADDCRPQ